MTSLLKKNILTTKYVFAMFLMAGVLVACESELEKEIEFKVAVKPAANISISNEEVTAPKGTTLHFDFEGEPDFISFSYERFIPTNATLSFSTQAAWGTHIDNTLSVFVSENFKALAGNDFKKDSMAIVSEKWTELTASANLPTSTNKLQKATISLNEYRGKNLTIAFRYKTEFEGDWQPTWIVSDLVIDNTLITDGSNNSTYLAATMGFLPFDMWNKNVAYESKSEAGVWNISNTAAMTINRTPRANPLNHDWLVSKPIAVPLGQTETSNTIAVKNISNRVNTYAYKFDNSGTYVLTFNAINQNYKYSNTASRSIKIVIN